MTVLVPDSRVGAIVVAPVVAVAVVRHGGHHDVVAEGALSPHGRVVVVHLLLLLLLLLLSCWATRALAAAHLDERRAEVGREECVEDRVEAAVAVGQAVSDDLDDHQDAVVADVVQVQLA